MKSINLSNMSENEIISVVFGAFLIGVVVGIVGTSIFG